MCGKDERMQKRYLSVLKCYFLMYFSPRKVLCYRLIGCHGQAGEPKCGL